MSEFETAKIKFPETIGKYLEDTFVYEWDSNILSIEMIIDPTPKDLLRGTHKIICERYLLLFFVNINMIY
jgi:hypothetical protein